MMCFLLETLASTLICWGSLTTGLKYPRIWGIIPSTQTTGSKKIPASAGEGSNQEQPKNINSWNCPCYIPSNIFLHNLFEALFFQALQPSAAWSKDPVLRLHFKDLAVGTGLGCDGSWMVLEFPIVFLWFCSFSIYGKTQIPHLLISQLTLQTKTDSWKSRAFAFGIWSTFMLVFPHRTVHVSLQGGIPCLSFFWAI